MNPGESQFIEHIIVTFLTTLGTVAPVAIGFVWAIKSDTRVLKQRLDTVDQSLESQNTKFDKQADKIDLKFTEFNKVLVTLAETSGRMDAQDQRALMQGARIDTLNRQLEQMGQLVQRYILSKLSDVPEKHKEMLRDMISED